MTDYYIDPAGDNANDGLSASTPKETWIAGINLLASPGDTLNLADGIYYTREHAIISIDGASGNEIIIRPTTANTRPSVRCMDLHAAADFSATGTAGTTHNVYQLSLPGNVAAEASGRVWRNGNAMTRRTWDTDVSTTFDDPDNQADEYAIDIVTDTLYVCVERSPQLGADLYESCLEDTRNDYVLRVFNNDHWQVEGLDFRGGFLATWWWSGFAGGTDTMNWTFTNCTFQQNEDDFILLSCTGDSANDSVVLTCTDCVFRNQSGDAYAIQSITGAGHVLTVEGCVFDDVDHGIRAGDATSWTGGAIRRNLFINLRDSPIWFGGGNAVASGTLDIYYNILVVSLFHGLKGDGGSADVNSGIRMWNNTVIRTAQAGMTVVGMDNTCSAKNNLILNCNRQNGESGPDDDYVIEVDGAAGPDVDYNLMFNDGATSENCVTAADDTTRTDRGLWATYIANTGQDVNSLNADPILVQVSPTKLGGAVPNASSPILAAGDDNSAIFSDNSDTETDYFGNPVNSANPTIGAVEHPARLRYDRLGAARGRLGTDRIDLRRVTLM